MQQQQQQQQRRLAGCLLVAALLGQSMVAAWTTSSSRPCRALAPRPSWVATRMTEESSSSEADAAAAAEAPIEQQQQQEEEVATVAELNAIVFATPEEKNEAVGNLVADDEWGGLTMELADLVRLSGKVASSFSLLELLRS
jgi:hypothetical protein